MSGFFILRVRRSNPPRTRPVRQHHSTAQTHLPEGA